MLRRLVGGCLSRLFFLALLAGGVMLAWQHRGLFRTAWQELRAVGGTTPHAPTTELAAVAERKLEALDAAEPAERVSLSEAEVQSILLYRMPDVIPPFVASPQVRFDEGRVRLSGRVPIQYVPPIGSVRNIAGFLPDTTHLVAHGYIVPHDRMRAALEIMEVSASSVPLPRRMIPGLLEVFGRPDEPGLAVNAMAVPLPPGARTAYVSGDSVVFLSEYD